MAEMSPLMVNDLEDAVRRIRNAIHDQCLGDPIDKDDIRGAAVRIEEVAAGLRVFLGDDTLAVQLTEAKQTLRKVMDAAASLLSHVAVNGPHPIAGGTFDLRCRALNVELLAAAAPAPSTGGKETP